VAVEPNLVDRGPDQPASPATVTPEQVLAALRDVADPEWPVSIVDMGLVCGVAVEDGVVRIALTFTSTACPCMEMIQDDVRERLRRLPGVRGVAFAVTWDPVWTKERLSDAARAQFRRWGVAV
jgi:metal-sulfur cluster biosynthetic enzyme